MVRYITYSNLVGFLYELPIPVKCVVFVQRIADYPIFYNVVIQKLHCLLEVWTLRGALFFVRKSLHWGLLFDELRLELDFG